MHNPVIIAGAGPGDEELITIKLLKALKVADIIIVDRLVNPAIISNNCKPGVIIHQAGKQGYNQYSYTQAEINGLLIAYAQTGKKVLRLKGGDVTIFSNLLDELETLTANNIPYEIIPGITAAAGAAAYGGIPLTAKGYSHGVQFLSFNQSSDFTQHEWERIAASKDTLVFYMGGKNINRLVQQLIAHGLNDTTPIAIISQATTPHQHIEVFTLREYAVEFVHAPYTSPTLIVIGNVASLYKKFNWFKTAEKAGSIFKELAKNKG